MNRIRLYHQRYFDTLEERLDEISRLDDGTIHLHRMIMNALPGTIYREHLEFILHRGRLEYDLDFIKSAYRERMRIGYADMFACFENDTDAVEFILRFAEELPEAIEARQAALWAEG